MFYLQQSVEKAVKAVLLSSLRNANITRKLRHEPVKKLVTDKEFDKMIKDMLVNLNNITISGNTSAGKYLQDALDRYLNYGGPWEIIRDAEQIRRDLIFIQDLERELAEHPEKLERVIVMVNQGRIRIDSRILNLGREFIRARIKDLRTRTQIPSKRISLPVVKLFGLSLILEHFAIVTRYYNEDLKLGPKDFNENNPIIQIWDTLYQTVQDTLNDVRRFFETP